MDNTLSNKEIYECLAEDTRESLDKALYDCPISMQDIVFRAIAKSEKATPKMMKKMIFETQFGFTKLQKDYGTGKMEEVSSSPRRDEKNVGDIHNFRSEAVSRLKEFVQSPAIKGNEVDTAELLYKIAANIPGNPRDVLDVFKTAVNSPHATGTTLGYAVFRTNFLLSEQKGDDARKEFTKDALDVFAAVADPKNAYKHTEESLTDFYYAITPFADCDSKKVTELVNKMRQSPKNTEKSLTVANNTLLGITKNKAKTNVGTQRE